MASENPLESWPAPVALATMSQSFGQAQEVIGEQIVVCVEAAHWR